MVNRIVLDKNARNHLPVCKKRAQAFLKMLPTKCFYKSYIFDIYV